MMQMHEKLKFKDRFPRAVVHDVTKGLDGRVALAVGSPNIPMRRTTAGLDNFGPSPLWRFVVSLALTST